MDISVKCGDAFGSSNPQSKVLGTGINAVQRIYAKDGQSVYGHSGVITNAQGDTIECLWKVKEQNIFKDYEGQRLIIARPTHTLTGQEIIDARKRVVIANLRKEYLGGFYPGWRLALHVFPVLAKHIHFLGKPVCSELVGKYLATVRARYDKYWGVNPDTLADEWQRWKNFEVIFEGVLK